MTIHERRHHDRALAGALAAAAAGQTERALRTARRVLRRQPAHVAARRLVAQLLLRQGRAREAIVELDAIQWYAQANDPTLQGAGGTGHLRLRVEALIRLGDTAGAIGALEELLTIRPNDPHALRRLAALHDAGDQTDRAVARLEQLGANRTASDDRQLVWLYDRLGRAGKAAALLDEMALAEPADRLCRARLLVRAGRMADAVAAYDQLTSANRDDTALQLEAARLAEELGDTARLGKHLHRALAFEPSNREALAMSAARRMRAGRFAAAGRRWWQLLRRCGEDDAALAHLTVCCACEHRTKLAAWSERKLRQRCSVARVRQLVAEAWRTATPGRLIERTGIGVGDQDDRSVIATLCEESADAFERELAAHPGFADHRYHLAACQARAGLKPIAAESVDMALRINPAYLDAVRLRTRLLIEAGHVEAAQQLIDDTLMAKPDTQRLVDLQAALDVLTGEHLAADRRVAEARVEPTERMAITHDVAQLLEHLDHPAAKQWRNRRSPVRRAA